LHQHAHTCVHADAGDAGEPVLGGRWDRHTRAHLPTGASLLSLPSPRSTLRFHSRSLPFHTLSLSLCLTLSSRPSSPPYPPSPASLPFLPSPPLPFLFVPSPPSLYLSVPSNPSLNLPLLSFSEGWRLQRLRDEQWFVEEIEPTGAGAGGSNPTDAGYPYPPLCPQFLTPPPPNFFLSFSLSYPSIIFQSNLHSPMVVCFAASCRGHPITESYAPIHPSTPACAQAC
jgi:hypothetical protein